MLVNDTSIKWHQFSWIRIKYWIADIETSWFRTVSHWLYFPFFELDVVGAIHYRNALENFPLRLNAFVYIIQFSFAEETLAWVLLGHVPFEVTDWRLCWIHTPLSAALSVMIILLFRWYANWNINILTRTSGKWQNWYYVFWELSTFSYDLLTFMKNHRR